MTSSKTFEPMTAEQRAQWNQMGLFPVERWGMGGPPDATPLVCPTPTNDELRSLASSVPDHIQLSGWYVGKPVFGRRYLYADNFRGMGRQWVCNFAAEKGYFDGLAEYVAAVHPRTVLKLLNRISELEARLDAIESKALVACVLPSGPTPPAAVPQWMPIKSAPKGDRTLILLLTSSGFPQVAYSNTWWVSGFSAENKPTHWMPLPPAPIGEKQ